MNFKKVFHALMLLMPSSAICAEFGLLDWHGATSGTSRSPNSAFILEQDNTYTEVWVKQGVTVFRHNNIKLDLYGKQAYYADTQDNAWNNLTAYSYGINLNAQLGEHWSLYYDLSHETHDRREGRRLEATRHKLGYNFYKQWWIGKQDKRLKFVTHNKRVIRLWGAFNFPASINAEEDDNWTFTPGGELSNHYELFDLGVEFIPYMNVNVSIDRDKDIFANKIYAETGSRIAYPIQGGEIYVQYGQEQQFLWEAELIEETQQLTAGWYFSW